MDSSPQALKSSQTWATADSPSAVDLEQCSSSEDNNNGLSALRHLAKTPGPHSNITDAAASSSSARPALVQTPMSEVSKLFDRHNKGYLDSMERQIRQDVGHKVYEIVTDLRTEQKQSTALLHNLERQQRHVTHLKKGLIALAILTVILALSNLGTSLAAARLAQEVRVNTDTGDLTDAGTGQRVGVTDKVVNIVMQPPTADDRRRHLSTLAEVSLCRDPTATEMASFEAGNATTNTTNITSSMNNATLLDQTPQSCEIVGTLSYTDMVLLHQQFCNGWPGQPGCSGGGVSQIRLECNGRISYLDDTFLDEHEPELDPYLNFLTFPALGHGYHGTHHAYPSNVDFYTGPPCLQDFLVGMYCDPINKDDPCLVFAAMPADTQPCFGEYVALCGDPVDFAERQAY